MAIRRTIVDGQKSSEKLTRLQGKHRPSLAKAILEAWDSLRDIEPRSSSVEVTIANALLDAINAAYVPAYTGTILDAGRFVKPATRAKGRQIQPKQLGVIGDSVVVDVDVIAAGWQWQTGSRAIAQWIQDHAGSLIVDITDQQLDAIRDQLAAGINESPEVLARQIRSNIGLTQQQLGWLDSRRAVLVAEGVSPQRAEQLLQVDRNRYLRSRANTIARTEVSHSWHHGQFQAIRSAQRDGELAEKVIKTWWTTLDERTGTVDRALDGQERGLDEMFEAEGEQFMRPPTRPNCRCSVTYEEQLL